MFSKITADKSCFLIVKVDLLFLQLWSLCGTGFDCLKAKNTFLDKTYNLSKLIHLVL